MRCCRLMDFYALPLIFLAKKLLLFPDPVQPSVVSYRIQSAVFALRHVAKALAFALQQHFFARYFVVLDHQSCNVGAA